MWLRHFWHSWSHAEVPGYAEFQYLYLSRIHYAFLNEPGCSVMSACCLDDNLNCFHWISFLYMYYLGQDREWNWRLASYLIKYAHNGWSCDLGIFGVYEVKFQARAFKLRYITRPYGAHNISPGFCCISIVVFFPFYAFINEPGCSVRGVRCPDDNFNCFWVDFKDIWNLGHLGQDLWWEWIWASYFITYAHNGGSCDFGIFGILEGIFSVRAFKLGMLRDLKGRCDISARLCQIPICVFFSECFTHFLINLAAHSWLVSGQ